MEETYIGSSPSPTKIVDTPASMTDPRHRPSLIPIKNANRMMTLFHQYPSNNGGDDREGLTVYIALRYCRPGRWLPISFLLFGGSKGRAYIVGRGTRREHIGNHWHTLDTASAHDREGGRSTEGRRNGKKRILKFIEKVRKLGLPPHMMTIR